jgi:hypothetical protein
MEDQTLDAVGMSGEAWILGAGYHFSAIGIDGLNLGLALGSFKATQKKNYESKELDVVLEYSFNDYLSLTAAYADVTFYAGLDEDSQPLQNYNQFRVIGNYNF